MNSTDDSFVRLQHATGRAQKARADGDADSLRAALREIQALLDARLQAESGFDGIVAIQAVLMAVQLPDLNLARQLAECMLRDVTRRLRYLNEMYVQSASRKQHQESRMILNEAYACARAFVPRVLSPPVSWILKAFAAQQNRAGPAVLWVLAEIRPNLSEAGWDQWPYAEDVAAAADRAAAQSLVHTGNAIMESAKGGMEGLLVEQALHCGLNAQALLPQDARDQLMADCKNLLGQVFHALGTAEQENALQCFEECIAIEESLPNLPFAARDHANAGAVALQLSQFYCVNGDEDQTNARRDSADQHLHAACAYFRVHGPKEDLRNSLVNLGAFYEYIRQPEDGAKALEEALGLMASFTGDEKYYGVKILGNLGTLHGELRHYELALAYLDQAIGLLDTLSEFAIESDSYLICYGGKGKFLCQTGRHADAEPFLARARERLETMRSSFTSEVFVYRVDVGALAAMTSPRARDLGRNGTTR